MRNVKCLLAGACMTLSMQAVSDTTVTMHLVSEKGVGEAIGTVQISEAKKGIVLTPMLSGLSAGLHGFHVHENGSCEPSTKGGKVTPAGAAGSHLNLNDAKHHGAPWGKGHTGDLPALFVNDDGVAQHPVFAPNLKMKPIDGKALIIHEGGDNYSDTPQPLGGGGARVACGIIKGN
ncbi:MAG TPA: superoxide dismutase [Cu-Zn] SodC [Marinagarivorans sp.]